MSEDNNIYKILNAVRERPGMWIKDGIRLSDLQPIIHGYETALDMHGIVESGPKFRQREFGDWLYKKTGIGAALGWAHIINEKYPDPNIAFTKFFEYLDEYRTLKSSELED